MSEEINISYNEQGYRVGQGHHNAKLTDQRVEELISDRDKGMTYLQIARKYGLSKSGVAGIISGRRRSQVVAVEKKKAYVSIRGKKERARYYLTSKAKSVIREAGGSRLIEKIANEIHRAELRTPTKDKNRAIERVLDKIRGL